MGGLAETRNDKAVAVLAILVSALHIALAGRYDTFRDELYFIVCGQHPSFGYVDQPAAIPLLAAALHTLADGPFPLRIPAALAAGALVWLAARFAKMLGGAGSSELLAALACALAPMLVGLGGVLSTTTFDPLAWTAIAYLVVRSLRFGSNRALILAGVITGLDFNVKYAVAFWIAGLLVGLAASRERYILGRGSFWLGASIAGLMGLPTVLWQALHGFPFLELGVAAQGKNAVVGVGAFMANQIMVMNPFAAPLWIIGLCAPFIAPNLRDLRFVPIAVLTVFISVRIGNGKDYYLAACYPVLFVIGSVAIAQFIEGPAKRAAAVIVLALQTGFAAIAAPVTMPLLSPEALSAYMARHGIEPGKQEKSFEGAVLPQGFADQLGWRDFADQIALAWQTIPASDREKTAILLDNYGEAAAIDIYGRQMGLPPALSGHNHYSVWGLRGQHPTDLIVVQRKPEELSGLCSQIIVVGVTWSKWAMPGENGKSIIRCASLKIPIEQLWPTQRHID